MTIVDRYAAELAAAIRALPAREPAEPPPPCQMVFRSRGGNDLGLTCECRKDGRRYPLIALRTRWTVPEARQVWQAWHDRRKATVAA